MADGGGSNYKHTVRYGVGHALVFPRPAEQLGSADSGSRFTKGDFVWIYYSQVGETEIAHGAGGRAEVERIARRHQHHAKIAEISRSSQASRFYPGARFRPGLNPPSP